MLAQYPLGVINAVTDPLNGLPSKLDWLPTLREVRDACELEMAPFRREEERRRRLAETSMLLAAPLKPRLTKDELAAKYGPGFGLGGEKGAKDRGKLMTDEELKEHFATVPAPSAELVENMRDRQAAMQEGGE